MKEQMPCPVLQLHTMTKRIANLLDAGLPPPPPLSVFLDVLKKQRQGWVTPQAKVDPIHGTMLSKKKKLSGTQNNERAAVRSALQFVEVCAHLQATYEDLDNWFVAWGAWIIDEKFLVDCATEMAGIRARRQRQADGSKFKFGTASPRSFRTYLNAVTRAYTQSVLEITLVASSKKQFPELREFMKDPIGRDRGER